ncbi:MAG: DUF2304 domain-containing protein [Candidatus Omnitrophota bacterium]
MDRIQMISVAVSLLLLLVVLRLIKTKHLKIEYSILWLLTASVLVVLSFSRSFLEKIARWLGVYYPPSLLFLFGFLFSLAIILHFSVVVSKLSEMNKELAQQLSILRLELEKMIKET